MRRRKDRGYVSRAIREALLGGGKTRNELTASIGVPAQKVWKALDRMLIQGVIKPVDGFYTMIPEIRSDRDYLEYLRANRVDVARIPTPPMPTVDLARAAQISDFLRTGW